MEDVFSDPAAELRCLAAFLDYPEKCAATSESLFTGQRVDIFRAMVKSYTIYQTITYESLVLTYGSFPQALEAARSASRPEPLIDYLTALAVRRSLRDSARQLMLLSSQANPSIDDIQRAMTLPSFITFQPTTLEDGIVAFGKSLRDKIEKSYEFLRTGIHFLDVILGGEWPRQALTVVIGEGGSGKTALICNSILAMASQGTASYFQSLEMPKSGIVARFISDMCSIDGLDLRNGTLSEDQYKSVLAASTKLSELPIYIDDTPGVSLSAIIDQIVSHKKRYGIKVAFVDYLQIIGGMGVEDESMSEVYGKYALELRNVSVRENIAVVLLAQQNRTHKGLHSIFGSGRVGHVADVVLELSTASKNEHIRPVQIEIHKHRNGPLGVHTVAYHAKYLRFGDFYAKNT